MLSLTNFYHSRTQQETEDKARQFEGSLMKELFTKCDLPFNKQTRDGIGSRDAMDCSPPGSLSTGFPREEYWSGSPFPLPRDLPDPGIKPTSLALAGGFFTTEPPGKSPFSW